MNVRFSSHDSSSKTIQPNKLKFNVDIRLDLRNVVWYILAIPDDILGWLKHEFRTFNKANVQLHIATEYSFLVVIGKIKIINKQIYSDSRKQFINIVRNVFSEYDEINGVRIFGQNQTAYVRNADSI